MSSCTCVRRHLVTPGIQLAQRQCGRRAGTPIERLGECRTCGKWRAAGSVGRLCDTFENAWLRRRLPRTEPELFLSDEEQCAWNVPLVRRVRDQVILQDTTGNTCAHA